MSNVLWLTLAASLLPAAAGAQVLASDADRREAMRHYRDGQEHLSGEQWERAADAFSAAVRFDRLLTDAHYGLGQAYMGLQRYTSAIVAFEGCLEAAQALHGLRDKDRVATDRQIDEEIRELKDTIRRLQAQPGQAGILKAVRLEQRVADLQRSRSSLGGAFEAPASVLLALGSAHFRSGHAAEAEHYWGEAVRVNGSMGEAWNNLAVIYLQTGRKSEAERAVRQAERSGFRVNPRLKEDIKRMKGT